MYGKLGFLPVGILFICSLGACDYRGPNEVPHHVQIEEERVISALKAFQRSAFRRPKNGTAKEVRKYIDELGLWGTVSGVLAKNDMSVEDLDDDEVFLLLVSGVMVRDDRGRTTWSALGWPGGDMPYCRYDFFQPDPDRVQDIDQDGWMEYRLPRLGIIRLCCERYAFVFAPDGSEASGSVVD